VKGTGSVKILDVFSLSSPLNGTKILFFFNYAKNHTVYKYAVEAGRIHPLPPPKGRIHRIIYESRKLKLTLIRKSLNAFVFRIKE
jgi:hypothetical protein